MLRKYFNAHLLTMALWFFLFVFILLRYIFICVLQFADTIFALKQCTFDTKNVCIVSVAVVQKCTTFTCNWEQATRQIEMKRVRNTFTTKAVTLKAIWWTVLGHAPNQTIRTWFNIIGWWCVFVIFSSFFWSLRSLSYFSCGVQLVFYSPFVCVRLFCCSLILMLHHCII